MADDGQSVPVKIHIVESEVVRVGDKVWVFNHLDTVSDIRTVMGGKVIYFTRAEFGEENFGLGDK